MKSRASTPSAAAGSRPYDARGAGSGTAVAWAVGMTMATVPCSARDAGRLLAATAARVEISLAELAAAMAAESRGTPPPALIGRALSQAVQAARTSPDARSGRAVPGLMPSTEDAEHALGRFFDARLRLVATPADEPARRALEDAIYTLCVLMAEPSAHAAVVAAVQYTET
ncbi:DUF5133 domain-containing protein [Streptomyces goshikiensis]|uniref:DUF5133 domain-containing protein n=1 Tax=Streptomyces goshikiensis TaxID=1942 RepID=UPI0036C80F63